MPGKVRLKLNPRDLARLQQALQRSTFEPALQKHVEKATARSGVYMAAQARQEVKKIKPANAALTIALKGGSGPLVGKTPPVLFQAIAFQQKAWNRGVVGVNRTEGQYNIAEVVHEGRKIPVTPKMRAMFYALARASDAAKKGGKMPRLRGRAAELFDLYKEWRPLRADTNLIVIPSRPFLAKAFRKRKNREYILAGWRDAVTLAIREVLGP